MSETKLLSKAKYMSGATRLISIDELNSFMKSVFEKAKPVKSYSGGKLSRVANYDIDKIISDSLIGNTVLYTDESKRLSGLYISFEDTTRFFKNDSKPKGIISVKEASQILDTYHGAVADLITRGNLECLPNKNKVRHLICLKSVESFKEKYIHVGAIAKKNNLNSTNLSEILASQDIYPSSSPEKDGSLTSIYLRKDIQDLDFKKIKAAHFNSSKTGRKSTIDISKISDIKILNLYKLTQEVSSINEFARKVNMASSNFASIFHGKKSFGELAARNMEQRLSLEPGWLSTPH